MTINGRNLVFVKIVLTRRRQDGRRREKHDMTDSETMAEKVRKHNFYDEWEAEGFFFPTVKGGRLICRDDWFWAQDESHQKQLLLQSYTAENIQGPVGGAVDWIWRPSRTQKSDGSAGKRFCFVFGWNQRVHAAYHLEKPKRRQHNRWLLIFNSWSNEDRLCKEQMTSMFYRTGIFIFFHLSGYDMDFRLFVSH